MSDEVRLVGAFVLAFALAGFGTPLARRLAIRLDFFDQPSGYKGHVRATPYLGGLAVVAGFVIAAVVFASGLGRFEALIAGVVALLAIGTLDDRVRLSISPRLTVQIAAAVALWAGDQGWELFPGEGLDLALTIVWVVGLINAFNLMDNIDGATGTVAGVCSLGAGTLATIQGDIVLAALAFAMAGACAGFLPHNLAKPSRIFLGDGGSMPIGLVVAASVMNIPDGQLHWATVLASAPLVALPIFDTALVVVSRYRRGAPILEGGRDHLTHRLLASLGTERRVALTLAIGQALMCAIAMVLFQTDPTTVIAASLFTLLAASLTLAAIETGFRSARPVERTG